MPTPSAFTPIAAPRRGRPPMVGGREHILRAAELIFAERDYHEVLMEDVAQACALGKGTLYRYFRSKRDLYLAVMFDGIERLRDHLRVAIEAPDAPTRKIEVIVRCILEHFWDRRFFFALIHRNEYKPDDPDNRAEQRLWPQLRRQTSAVPTSGTHVVRLRTRPPWGSWFRSSEAG